MDSYSSETVPAATSASGSPKAKGVGGGSPKLSSSLETSTSPKLASSPVAKAVAHSPKAVSPKAANISPKAGGVVNVGSPLLSAAAAIPPPALVAMKPTAIDTTSITSTPNPASAAAATSAKKRGTLVREQLKYCSTILKTLRKHRDAYPFLSPVDPVALKIPDYFSVIKNPMDLSTIKGKLEQVAYEDAEEFVADVRQMLQNCYTYNGLEAPVSKMAKNLEKAFEAQLAKMPTEASLLYSNLNQPEITSSKTPLQRKRSRSTFSPTNGHGNVKKNTVAEQIKFCNSVFKELVKPSNNAFAWPFLQPVDPVALGIPDYFNVIKHPMDLSTVQRKLETGQYRSCEEFKADIDLMFENCYIFNPPDSDVVAMAKKLQSVFMAKYARKPIFVSGSNAAAAAAANDYDDEDISEEETEQIRKIQLELADLQTKLSDLLERKRQRKLTRKRNDPFSPRPSQSSSAVKKAKRQQPPTFLTYEEKKKLSEDIAELTEQQQVKVLQIIQDSMPKIAEQGQDEIELDIETLDIKTLVSLQKYVNEINGRKKAKKSGASAAALPPSNVRYDSEESSSEESDFAHEDDEKANRIASKKKQTPKPRSSTPASLNGGAVQFGVIDHSIINSHQKKSVSEQVVTSNGNSGDGTTTPSKPPVIANVDSWNNMVTSPTNGSLTSPANTATLNNNHKNSNNNSIQPPKSPKSLNNNTQAWSSFKSHAINQREREQARVQLEQQMEAARREKELEAERALAAKKAQEESDLAERKRLARLELLKETSSAANANGMDYEYS